MDINIASKRDTLFAATKRVTIELLRTKGKVLAVQQLVDTLNIDARKICQVLFVLQGIGFLIFVSPTKVIYPGIIASIHNFLAFVRRKLEKHDDGTDTKDAGSQGFVNPNKSSSFEMPVPGQVFSFSEITLNKHIIDVNSMHYLSEFVRQVVNEILFDNSKLTRQDDTQAEDRASVREVRRDRFRIWQQEFVLRGHQDSFLPGVRKLTSSTCRRTHPTSYGRVPILSTPWAYAERT